jgi:putative NADH-flavin reductase
MKLLVLGATGNTGQRLVRMGLAQGNDVTAFVRSARKLADLLGGQLPQKLSVREGDVTEQSALIAAMKSQDAVINAAGNATQPEGYVAMVATIIAAAEEALGNGGRFWLFGGAAALDVPGTKLMTVDLPKVPAIFKAHKANFERVSRSKLDWSMLCPGPMTEAPDGKPHRGLRVSTDTWPVPRPALLRLMPLIATTIAFRSAMPEMTITYEDAAHVILSNLVPNGLYARKRVGIALPVGVKGRKKLPSGSR